MMTDPQDQSRQASEQRQQGDQQGIEQAGKQGNGQEGSQQAAAGRHDATDGLADKKPEELTPEELRLMADTMPGEGPGD